MTDSGRKASPPALIARPDAAAMVQAAAAAAGLTVEQLAELMVDGGFTALPPTDELTQRYTLEDLGKRLWSEAQTMLRTKRGEWFHGLLPVQQKALIVMLRDRGFSSFAIANDFQLDPMDVTRTWNKHADELGSQVVGLRLNTIAGQMQLVAERAMEIEMEKGNGRAVWSIEKDRIAILQSLGIVEQAVHKSEVTHKLDDAARAEIQALVDLEQKKLAQRESIRVIEAEIFDAPPDELDDAED